MALTAEEMKEFEALFGTKPDAKAAPATTPVAPATTAPASRTIPDVIPTKSPTGPDKFDQTEFDQYLAERKADPAGGAMETFGDTARSYLNSASMGFWPWAIDKAGEFAGSPVGMREEVVKGQARSPVATTGGAIAGKIPWWYATRGAIAPVAGTGMAAGGLTGAITSAIDQGGQVLRGERSPTDVNWTDLGVSTAAGGLLSNPLALLFPKIAALQKVLPAIPSMATSVLSGGGVKGAGGALAKELWKGVEKKALGVATPEAVKSALPPAALGLLDTISEEEQRRANKRKEHGR